MTESANRSCRTIDSAERLFYIITIDLRFDHGCRERVQFVKAWKPFHNFIEPGTNVQCCLARCLCCRLIKQSGGFGNAWDFHVLNQRRVSKNDITRIDNALYPWREHIGLKKMPFCVVPWLILSTPRQTPLSLQ